MQTIQKAERSVAGGFAGAATNGLEDRTTITATPGPSPALTTTNPDEQRGHKVRAMLRARLGAALRDHVHRSYSASVVAPQWEALFRKLAARRATASTR